ncbi:hypothetical protein CXG81DRAFT_26615 [Caulochytrium protostelioides]|uniref:Uncharacterized protein n=1 Tax=Caulochytrium protostelioides TaxID=1555241 RepID=A0A4P9X677_9FUNG|nr:hypothetical protein CXG81DRAFT_26615 [Caulochytrium protostelioides]|eukprot:RKP00668.1 hypothetical protein CXG81DRAFT_26615 [Caulochytrium protostelioides]
MRKKVADAGPIVTAIPGAENPLLGSPDQTEKPKFEEPKFLNQYCIIGNDPGRTNIFIMAMVGFKAHVASWKLSQKYFVEAGMKAAQKAPHANPLGDSLTEFLGPSGPQDFELVEFD